jgi:1,4-dihydroxy-2-naphthoyl-CoA hydrolase
MFTYTTRLRMRDTDAGGVLFFARQFDLVHEALEAFLDELGFGLGRQLDREDFITPVVHAESDYRLPVRLGDSIRIRLSVEHIGRRSFTVSYELCNDAGKTTGTARTTHVAISKATRKAIPLPPPLRESLEKTRQSACASQ